MTKRAIGFYWTLPVPWAGFGVLPPDIDTAAKMSRTIRYQQVVIHAHAHAEGYRLIHEEVFMELAPDRGTDIILGPLAKVEHLCRTNDAVLLYVDFWAAQGWRRHGFLRAWIARTGIRTEEVPPDSVMIDGAEFDPHAHFAEWRRRQQEWMASKAARAEATHCHASRLRGDGLSYAAVAHRLNAEGHTNLTGKPWTADNLRKFMAMRKVD